jgi:RNA polymerase sigma-70 factor (family 1)
MRKQEQAIEEIVIELRQGSEKSFEIIFSSLYPALCFYAFQITGNQPAAEDIAEECLLKIWNRRDQFFEFNFLKSFLYKTVRNACIDWLRVENGHQLHHIAIAALAVQQEKTAMENIIQAEVFRELHTVLDTLPPQCRKVVTMFYMEGKPVRQIATELQVAIGTVKKHKKRGLILLKKRLPGLFLIFMVIKIFFPC